jgi:hypothetical protein
MPYFGRLCGVSLQSGAPTGVVPLASSEGFAKTGETAANMVTATVARSAFFMIVSFVCDD